MNDVYTTSRGQHLFTCLRSPCLVTLTTEMDTPTQGRNAVNTRNGPFGAFGTYLFLRFPPSVFDPKRRKGLEGWVTCQTAIVTEHRVGTLVKDIKTRT
jgi:hypothetical protein